MTENQVLVWDGWKKGKEQWDKIWQVLVGSRTARPWEEMELPTELHLPQHLSWPGTLLLSLNLQSSSEWVFMTHEWPELLGLYFKMSCRCTSQTQVTSVKSRSSVYCSIGSNDEQCVQRAGTWLTWAVDPRLPVILCLRGWLQILIPITGGG